MKNHITTGFSHFYKAERDNETRYFPANGSANRSEAMAFDGKHDPVRVGGFAVYDTSVSTEYAVALFVEFSEAAAYAYDASHKQELPTTEESKPDTPDSESVDDFPEPDTLEVFAKKSKKRKK